MQKLINPFSGEEVEMKYMFDTQSIPEEDQIRTLKILNWMVNHKGEESCVRLVNALKQILGEKGYRLFGEMYLKTYNEKTKEFRRYFYFKEQDYISYVFNIFNLISTNYGFLGSQII